MSYTFASATILLLLITDPLGNIPIFANALRGVAPERRARVILREVLIAFALLLVFLFFGAQFLRVMNLSDLSLQIAGAVVLFLIALRMIFPPDAGPPTDLPGEPLIVPLAIPALAGPSAMKFQSWWPHPCASTWRPWPTWLNACTKARSASANSASSAWTWQCNAWGGPRPWWRASNWAWPAWASVCNKLRS